jgi:hypothetical protein
VLCDRIDRSLRAMSEVPTYLGDLTEVAMQQHRETVTPRRCHETVNNSPNALAAGRRLKQQQNLVPGAAQKSDRLSSSEATSTL